MNSKREKVATSIFLEAQGQLTLWSMVGSGRISKSSKLLCLSSLPARMKRIWWRTAEEKWQHHFSHYRAMGIFSDAQRQLTPQTVVGSGRISNSSKLSCMSSLPASMKGLDENQPRKSGNTVFIILTLSVAMETSCLIWPNFELTKALMYVTNICKYEKDRIQNSWEKSGNTVFPL